MQAERQKIQLKLAFGKRSEGEARSGACKGTEVCVARVDTERSAVFISVNLSNRHVRICAGGVGKPAFLPQRAPSKLMAGQPVEVRWR